MISFVFRFSSGVFFYSRVCVGVSLFYKSTAYEVFLLILKTSFTVCFLSVETLSESHFYFSLIQFFFHLNFSILALECAYTHTHSPTHTLQWHNRNINEEGKKKTTNKRNESCSSSLICSKQWLTMCLFGVCGLSRVLFTLPPSFNLLLKTRTRKMQFFSNFACSCLHFFALYSNSLQFFPFDYFQAFRRRWNHLRRNRLFFLVCCKWKEKKQKKNNKNRQCCCRKCVHRRICSG